MSRRMNATSLASWSSDSRTGHAPPDFRPRGYTVTGPSCFLHDQVWPPVLQSPVEDTLRSSAAPRANARYPACRSACVVDAPRRCHRTPSTSSNAKPVETASITSTLTGYGSGPGGRARHYDPRPLLCSPSSREGPRAMASTRFRALRVGVRAPSTHRSFFLRNSLEPCRPGFSPCAAHREGATH